MTNTNPTDALLSSLGQAYFAARDHMYARNTAANRAACRDASRAYSDALDLAAQDGARDWSR